MGGDTYIHILIVSSPLFRSYVRDDIRQLTYMCDRLKKLNYKELKLLKIEKTLKDRSTLVRIAFT